MKMGRRLAVVRRRRKSTSWTNQKVFPLWREKQNSCQGVYLHSTMLFGSKASQCSANQLRESVNISFDNLTMHVQTTRWVLKIWTKSSYLKKKQNTTEQDQGGMARLTGKMGEKAGSEHLIALGTSLQTVLQKERVQSLV